jgi:hypothetical protein
VGNRDDSRKIASEWEFVSKVTLQRYNFQGSKYVEDSLLNIDKSCFKAADPFKRTGR